MLGWKSCRIWERLQSYGREKDLLMARCWSISFLIALLVRISAVLMHYEQVSLRLASFRERLFCPRSFGLSKNQDSDHHNALFGHEEFVLSVFYYEICVS